MSIFTFSANFFEQLQPRDFSYLGSVLFRFTNDQNQHKIALDKNGVLAVQYRKITQNMFCADIIKSWLELISNIPSSVENYSVNFTDGMTPEDMCVEVCSNINGPRALIIYSSSTFCIQLDDNCKFLHSGRSITAIDKDEAKSRLNISNITNINNINNSIVSGQNINDSQNIINNDD